MFEIFFFNIFFLNASDFSNDHIKVDNLSRQFNSFINNVPLWGLIASGIFTTAV